MADAPEPAVMLVVPPLTVVTDVPETVAFDRLIEVIKAPADEAFPVVIEPPVRLAEPV